MTTTLQRLMDLSELRALRDCVGALETMAASDRGSMDYKRAKLACIDARLRRDSIKEARRVKDGETRRSPTEYSTLERRTGGGCNIVKGDC